VEPLPHRLLFIPRGNIYPSWPESFRCKAVRDRVADLSAWQRLGGGLGCELEECDKWPSGGQRRRRAIVLLTPLMDVIFSYNPALTP